MCQDSYRVEYRSDITYNDKTLEGEEATIKSRAWNGWDNEDGDIKGERIERFSIKNKPNDKYKFQLFIYEFINYQHIKAEHVEFTQPLTYEFPMSKSKPTEDAMIIRMAKVSQFDNLISCAFGFDNVGCKVHDFVVDIDVVVYELLKATLLQVANPHRPFGVEEVIFILKISGVEILEQVGKSWSEWITLTCPEKIVYHFERERAKVRPKRPS